MEKNNKNIITLSNIIKTKTQLLSAQAGLDKNDSNYFDMEGKALNTSRVLRLTGGNYSIYDLMMDEPRISLAVESRINTVMSMNFSIVPQDANDSTQKTMSDFVANIFDKFNNLDSFIRGLLLNMYYGITYNEIMFDKNYIPYDVIWRHPSRFFRKINSSGVLETYLIDKENINGKLINEEKFIIITSNDMPYGKSVLDRVYALYLIKKIFLESWTAFGEEQARPTLLAKLSPNARAMELDRSELAETLEQGRQSSIMIFDENEITEIKNMIDGTSSVGDFYNSAIEYIDKTITMSINHQLASTQATEGKLGHQDEQNQTKMELAISDSNNIKSGINKLIKLICDLHFATNDSTVYPVCNFGISKAVDIKQARLALQAVTEAFTGFQFSESQIRDTFGFTPPIDDNDILVGSKKSNSALMMSLSDDSNNEKLILQESNKRKVTSFRNLKRKQDEEYKKIANNAIELAYNDITEYYKSQVEKSSNYNDIFDISIPNNLMYKVISVFENYFAFVGWQSRVALEQQYKSAKRGMKLANGDKTNKNDYIIDINFDEMPEPDFWLLETPQTVLEYFSNQYSIDPKSGERIVSNSINAGVRIGKEEDEYIRNRWQTKVDSAIKAGMTLREFKNDFKNNAEKYTDWGTSAQKPYHVESIYRTNLAEAWETTKVNELREDEFIKEFFPYLEYIAIIDSRTDPYDEQLNGFIAKVDDPIWQTITPPNHYNCRCTTRPISIDEFEEDYGGKISTEISDKIIGYSPQAGFEQTNIV